MIRLSSLLLAVVCCPLAFGGVDTGLISLLPAGTQMVFNLNAEESRNSQFGRYLLQDMHWSDAKVQQMIATTGFDPRRDLITLLVATPQANLPAGQPGTALVLARGNFDAAKIGAAATQHGWTKQLISNATIYTENGSHGQTHGFSFLDVDVAVMGDLDSLRQVIANRSNSARLDPDLERLMNQVSPDNDVWFASVGAPNGLPGALGSNAANGSNMSGVVRSISQSSGGIKFGNTVQFSFDALTKTDKDAMSLADVVRFVASAAQVKRDQDPNAALLAPALDNLKLTSAGNAVHVATSLPEDSLEAFAAQMRTNNSAPPHTAR